MKTVKLNLQQFNDIKSIWEKRDFPLIDPRILSSFCYGQYKDQQLVSFVFLYPMLGSKLCWLGFPSTNSDIEKELRKESLTNVISDTMKIAKDMGYEYIMTTTGTDTIEQQLNKLNFQLTDENVGLYFRGLNG